MSLYDDLDKDVEVIRSEINALANKPPPPLKPKAEPPKPVEPSPEELHKISMGKSFDISKFVILRNAS
jgi:hypothetical protein